MPPKRQTATTSASTSTSTRSTRAAKVANDSPEDAAAEPKKTRATRSAASRAKATEEPQDIPSEKPKATRKRKVNPADESKLDDPAPEASEKRRGRSAKAPEIAKKEDAPKTRKTRSAQPDQQPQDTIDSVQEGKEEPPQPKKRGRPPKAASAQPEPANKPTRGRKTKAPTTVQPTKKTSTRGRQKDKEVESEPEPEVVEDAKPKRRGRPKKEALPAEEKEAKSTQLSQEEQQTDPKPAAKKRGRKAVIPDSVEEPPKAPPAKRRGRPPKSATKDPASQDEEAAPVRKKRGQPPKSDAGIESAKAGNAELPPPSAKKTARPSLDDAQENLAIEGPGRPSEVASKVHKSTPRQSLLAPPASAKASAQKGGRASLSGQRVSGSTPTVQSTGKRDPSRSAQSIRTVSQATPSSGKSGQGRPPKRHASINAEDLESAPQTKRQRNEEVRIGSSTAFASSGISGVARRKTIAAKSRMQTPKRARPLVVPGTAPAKAAGRKSKTPLKQADAAATEQLPIAIVPEPEPTSTDAQLATPARAMPSADPSKTAPPKGVLGQAGSNIRRKRQSSPGPAQPRAKRVKLDDLMQPIGEPDAGPSYWLLKAEPESRIVNGKDVKFSIDDLMMADSPEPWTGVRNYAARNHMKAMKKGDLGFFYHSSCKVPGVVGIMEIAKEAVVDETAFDESDPYYDPKSSRDNPRWACVSVVFRQRFDNPERTTLVELKKHSTGGGELENMMLFRQTRLSVIKVTKEEWNFILNLAGHLEDLAGTDGVEVAPLEPVVSESSIPTGTVDAAEDVAENEANVKEEADHAEDRIEVAKEGAKEQFAQRLEEVFKNVGQAAGNTVQNIWSNIGNGTTGILQAGEHVASQAIEELRDMNGAVSAIENMPPGVPEHRYDAIIPTTEELSELPDAPPLEEDGDEALDLVVGLPMSDSLSVISPIKPSNSRHASRAKSLSRSRRSSRAPSLLTVDGLMQSTPEKSLDPISRPPATLPRAAARALDVHNGSYSDPFTGEDE